MHKKGLIVLSILVVGVVAGVFILAGTNKGSGDGMVCGITGKPHVVHIKDGKMDPRNTTGTYCDTLTIENDDSTTREIGFGPHDHHEAYDGTSERLLAKGEHFTVTMTERGTFHFHDHFHEEVAGSFTVK